MPPRSSQRDRETPPGRPAVPSSAMACGWAGLGLVESPQPEPPGPSSSGTARGPAAGLDEGAETVFLVLPHVQQRLMFLVESRERLDDIRKWRTRRR